MITPRPAPSVEAVDNIRPGIVFVTEITPPGSALGRRSHRFLGSVLARLGDAEAPVFGIFSRKPTELIARWMWGRRRITKSSVPCSTAVAW